MADNIQVTPGSGPSVAADDVGGVLFQRIKPTFGADGTATDVSATNPLPVVQIGATPAGTANIGDVDVLTVPADPFGANADAASVSGSVSAKLRAIATALGATALDTGAGLATARTLRVVVDNAQIQSGKYQKVDASATATALGAGGGLTGDFVSHIVIVPETLNPGQVLLLDNAISHTIFVGGTASVGTLIPFTVQLEMTSVSGPWKITTGAGVHVVAVGNFT